MQEIKEEWKDIEGYFGLYQISNLGNIKSLGNGNSNNSKEKILKTAKLKNNYLRVILSKDGKRKTHLVHRLVAEAFIPNPNNYEQINHRDEQKTNNASSNLEWCTPKQNTNYGTRNQRVAEKLSKQVICVETGKIYHSIQQIQRQLGFAHQCISAVCTGKRKTYKGLHFKFV